MQQSERFGDTQAAQRPMLQRVLRDGIEQFGLEVDALGASSRAIVPLRAVDRQDSEVIGALEVGYNVLSELPDLSAQLAAGLAPYRQPRGAAGEPDDTSQRGPAERGQ